MHTDSGKGRWGSGLWTMLAICLGLCSATAGARAVVATPDRWIKGSRVAVLAAYEPSSAVVGHLIINARVVLLEQDGRGCRIGWGQGLQGFLPCRMLGEAPLALEEVATVKDADGAENPRYSPPSAFWIQPSIGRLLEAGEYFERTRLSSQQLGEESPREEDRDWERDPQIRRFRIDEFEAMKTLMRQGVIEPASSRVHEPVLLDELRRIISSPLPENSYYPLDGHWVPGGSYARLYMTMPLVEIRPSFFKSLDEVAGPYAPVESLSAQFGLPLRLKVLDRPKWLHSHFEAPVVQGAWDIGKLELRLVRPLYEIGVGQGGGIAIGTTDARTLRQAPEESCQDHFVDWQPQKLLPGYRKPGAAAVFFRMARKPDLKKAVVRSTEMSLDFSQSHLLRIDLDADGIDDLAMLQSSNLSGDTAETPGEEAVRVLFVNVQGRWYALDTFTATTCTC